MLGQMYGFLGEALEGEMTKGRLEAFSDGVIAIIIQGGLKNIYDCVKAFSETNFTEDLEKFDVPQLIMHGEDDQVVPIDDAGKKSAKLIKGAKEIYYPGLPHGLTATHADQVNADLLALLQLVQMARRAA